MHYRLNLTGSKCTKGMPDWEWIYLTMLDIGGNGCRLLSTTVGLSLAMYPLIEP